MPRTILLLLVSLAAVKAFLPPVMPGRPQTIVSFARVPIREGIQRAGSLLAPSKASGVIMVKMTGGDGDKDSKDNDENSDEGGLERFFEKQEGEKMSKFEYWGNYIFDLITLTAGAGVFTCLLLNFLGRVPCIG